MTGGPGNAAGDGHDGGPPRRPSPEGGPGSGGNLGWTIFSYLIAGMLFYGAIGWLIGHWTGHPLIFPLGALAGLAISVGLVIYRYGRS
jgi:fatty acid desaturase